MFLKLAFVWIIVFSPLALVEDLAAPKDLAGVVYPWPFLERPEWLKSASIELVKVYCGEWTEFVVRYDDGRSLFYVNASSNSGFDVIWSVVVLNDTPGYDGKLAVIKRGSRESQDLMQIALQTALNHDHEVKAGKIKATEAQQALNWLHGLMNLLNRQPSEWPFEEISPEQTFMRLLPSFR